MSSTQKEAAGEASRSCSHRSSGIKTRKGPCNHRSALQPERSEARKIPKKLHGCSRHHKVLHLPRKSARQGPQWSTKYCTCHDFRKRTTCPKVTIHCTCHEVIAFRRPPPCPKCCACQKICTSTSPSPKCAQNHNESAPSRGHRFGAKKFHLEISERNFFLRACPGNALSTKRAP